MPAPAPAPAPAADACIVAGQSGREVDTLDVLFDPEPGTSLPPVTGSDWFSWAHTYETLVRLDCTGVPRPALAASWRPGDDGRSWIVETRSASSLPSEAVTQAVDQLPARLAQAGFTSVVRDGDHQLHVSFDHPSDSVPAILADLSLAMRRSALPLAGAPSRPVLRALPRPSDLRDAIDDGMPIVVTTDPVTLDYARRRPDREVVPLPWSAVYVLVSPHPFPAAADDRFRAALAQDVVRAEARAAGAEYWWSNCGSGPGAAEARDSLLAYPARDPSAASLAARLVALGVAGPRGAVLPMEPGEIPHRLGRGDLAGAVVALPVELGGPCPRSIPAGYVVTPLVETRAHLVGRRDGPAIRRDAFGVLRVDGPSPPQPAP
ncbi:MAG TPA: hypothetical protein VFM14_02500 [Gemmatimonadales bacterium]|nr:hypothetical protein [Gemmatimonadales bacterium]